MLEAGDGGGQEKDMVPLGGSDCDHSRHCRWKFKLLLLKKGPLQKT